VYFAFVAVFGLQQEKNELVVLENGANSHRKILKEYSLEFIDNMLSIVTACTVMAYSLYTFMSSNENYYMMLTIPYVLYGIFRYQYIIYQKKEVGVLKRLFFRTCPYDKHNSLGTYKYNNFIR